MNDAAMIGEKAQRPRIGLVLGDPAGIGAELAARLLADPRTHDAAAVQVIGDARLLAAGAKIARVALPAVDIDERANADPAALPLGRVSAEGGRAALDNFRHALAHARDGALDAIVFTPFNKQALRLGGMSFDDELRFAADFLGHTGPHGEFNVLDQLWNARVTSHLPLADVAKRLSVPRIVEAIALTDHAMRAAGYSAPRIAVAALNPHAGDGGNYGHEEIEVIAPAVAAARAQGIETSGPYPADTVWIRARAGQFDAVVTMYHDQGQIAIKLLGFERGVTVLGGLPIPITTPAHGTAYDIAGKGIANDRALKRAFEIAVDMGRARCTAAIRE
ncbi:MAG: 4-hydroxythreonine-4-phosphate dehydrogenase [Betaproteobacteria bacterium SG8_39]|nr:MAG: 4-hydroxythreonine-4-phosphate dehydrogenase [Betaproteobacteria bacterium SG8_39]